MTSTRTNPELQIQLNRLMDAFKRSCGDKLPATQMDAHWLSPCLNDDTQVSNGKLVSWLPTPINEDCDMFDRLAQAIEHPIHPDIITFFCSYWSDHIQCSHSEGELTLLLCWNSEDMENLRGNLIGHLLAARKKSPSPSLFFACTEGEEFMTIDNISGEVWLERPGGKRMRKLSDDLAQFLSELTPLPPAELI